jgi:hypothetical protein
LQQREAVIALTVFAVVAPEPRHTGAVVHVAVALASATVQAWIADADVVG